jgi:hypothetical protein
LKWKPRHPSSTEVDAFQELFVSCARSLEIETLLLFSLVIEYTVFEINVVAFDTSIEPEQHLFGVDWIVLVEVVPCWL